jgi:hypothetical protein
MSEEATERLFDVGPESTSPMTEKAHTWVVEVLGVVIVGTRTQAERAAAGFHPTSALPFAQSGTCGECSHLCATGRNRTHYKCDLVPPTHGPGTDVKRKWPACNRFERAEAAGGK